jgi:hypothetical protein
MHLIDFHIAFAPALRRRDCSACKPSHLIQEDTKRISYYGFVLFRVISLRIFSGRFNHWGSIGL